MLQQMKQTANEDLFSSWSSGTTVRNEDDVESCIALESQCSFKDEEAKRGEFSLFRMDINQITSEHFLKRLLPTSSSTDVRILRRVRLLRLWQLAGTFVMARRVFLLKIQRELWYSNPFIIPQKKLFKKLIINWSIFIQFRRNKIK